MTRSQILFGLDGRLARLAYFNYVVFANIIILMAMLAAYFLLLASKPLGIAAIACGAIAFLWMGVALGVKRLHDMGWSGKHMAWIVAINVVAILTSNVHVGLALVTGLANLAVLLWLLFAPGDADDNAYGLA